MRKVDAELVKAIRHQTDFSKGNRQVIQNENGTTDVFFHGHRIAAFINEDLMIDNCGYWTNTTKQILNVLLGEFCNSTLHQSNFDWFVTSPSGEQEYLGGAYTVSLA